jgi:hypothetical protein
LKGRGLAGWAIRSSRRQRQIKATIPEPGNQKNNRLRRGGKCGRPPAFDPGQALLPLGIADLDFVGRGKLIVPEGSDPGRFGDALRAPGLK